MSSDYKRPSEAELPAALAKEMGWGERTSSNIPGFLSPSDHPYEIWGNGIMIFEGTIFNPCNDHNHAKFAIERCSKLDLMDKFCKEIDDGISSVYLFTTSQKSFAAHRILFEHNHKETQ